MKSEVEHSLSPGPDPEKRESAASPLSSPLDLRRRLSKPEVRFNPIPLLDLCVLALLFGLLQAEFVFAPGLTIDLPSSQTENLSGLPVTAVLTVRRNMILFDGARYTPIDLEEAMRRYLDGLGRRAGHASEPVLLVKMERNVTIDRFIEICEIARAAGFAKIQAAAEPRSVEPAASELVRPVASPWPGAGARP